MSPQIRRTRQRDAIRRSLEATERPLSPAEVLEIARREIPGLGIATVYRAINALERDGVIVPVQFPGDPARYEFAGKRHHHHFRCRRCGRVFEVQGCMGTGESITPTGFTLEGHELLLFGVCRACGNGG